MNPGRTASPPANRTLSSARAAKQDEFYTQLAEIANELKHYKEHLRGKTILCNCDDPFESNFFKYLALNLRTLGIKKLVATTYQRSPIVGGQVPLLEIEGLRACYALGIRGAARDSIKIEKTTKCIAVSVSGSRS